MPGGKYISLSSPKGTDPNCEFRVQRRLRFYRNIRPNGGVVSIPESWVAKDPALAQAVQELDWLRIEGED